MAQFARPITDVDAGSWTTTPFFSKIDEDIGGGGDDVTVASEAVGNNTNTTDLDLEATNTGLADPASSADHILRVLWASSSSRDIIGHFELWQGVPDVGTLIADNTVTLFDATEITSAYTLTGTEADNITDYNDLYFTLWGRGAQGGTDRSLVVDAIEFEFPDAATLAVFTQNAFRFRTNDTPGLNDNAGGDWEDALDTNVSLVPDIIFRLRVEIEGITNAETEGFQLRVQKNGSGGYLLIPNNATPHDTPSSDGQKRIQAVPSEAYTDLAATTDILSASAHTFLAGDGNDDNTTGTVPFTAPSHTEMEWALLVRKLSEDEHIIDTDFFEFRVYRDDGTVLDNYDVTPRVTVLNDPGHIGGTRIETPGRNWVATAEGVLYTILEYTDITTKNQVVMMKSTDGGDSWNPVDEAGAPTQNDLEACDLDYIAADDTIYIVIQGETNDDVIYWTFRTSNHASADTWDIDQNIDVASSVGLSQKVAVARRAGDNTTVAFYMDNDGSNDIIRYRILTGTTWGGELTLDTEGSREFRGVVVTRESDDTLHIFYLREDPGVLTEVYHRTMDPTDDSLSGRTQVDQTAVMANATNSGHAPIGQPRIWDDGGTIRVGVAYQDGSRDGYWNQSIVTTIDFTNEALITTETMHWNGGGSHAWDGDSVVDDNLDEPWAFWVRDSNDNLNSNHEVSGSWGSDVNERTGIHHSVSLIIFVHNGGNGGARVIGMMTESNPNAAFSGGTGSVRYFEPVTLASIGQTIAIGVLAEANALVSAGPIKVASIGVLGETEALVAAGPGRGFTVTTLGETDLLVTAAPVKVAPVGTLTEVEALISAGVSIFRTVGTLPEIDALLPTPPVEEQIVAVTTLAEIEALIAISARKIAMIGTLAESQVGIKEVGDPIGGSASDGGNVTLDFTPITLKEGDLVLLTGGNSDDTGVDPIGPSTGGYTQDSLQHTASETFAHGVWYKFMGATPDTQVVGLGTGDTNDAATYVAHFFRGVDSTTPIDAVTVKTGPTISTNPDLDATTTVTNKALVIITVGGHSTDTDITFPAGYSSQVYVLGVDSLRHVTATAIKQIPLNGTEDPAAFSGWASFDHVGFTIALRPAFVTRLIPIAAEKPIITAVGVIPETDALIPAVVKQFQTIDIGTLATGGVRVGPVVAAETWGTGTGTDWTIAQGGDFDWTKTNLRETSVIRITSGEGEFGQFPSNTGIATVHINGQTAEDIEIFTRFGSLGGDVTTGLAIIVRRSGSDTFYSMGIARRSSIGLWGLGGTTVDAKAIVKFVGGTITGLAETAATITSGAWRIRARIVGTRLKLKVWQGSEPSAWDLEVNDSELTGAHEFGIHGSGKETDQFEFPEFTASSAIGSGLRPIFAQFEPQTVAVATLAETDALIPTSPVKVAVIGTLVETDGLVSITGIKTADVGTLTETNSLIVIAVIQPGAQNIAVTTLAELEALIAIQAIKLVPIGTLVETDVLIPVPALQPIVTSVGTLATGGLRVGPELHKETWGTGSGTDWTIAQGGDFDWLGPASVERGTVTLSIASGEGHVDGLFATNTIASLYIDGQVGTDIEILTEVTASGVGAKSGVGIVLRRLNKLEYYSLGIAKDPDALTMFGGVTGFSEAIAIIKDRDGSKILLAAKSATFTNGDWWIRARISGTHLKVKVWQGSEPDAWDLEVEDNEISGNDNFGLHIAGETGGEFDFSEFTVSKAIGGGPRPIFAQFEPQTVAVTVLAESNVLIPAVPQQVIDTAVTTLAETDTLIAAGVSIFETIGTLAEIESLITAQATKVASIGTLAETDSLVPVGVSIYRFVGTLAETDALITAEVVQAAVAVTTLAETNALVAIEAVKDIITSVGTFAEIESLLAVAGIKIANIGTLGQVDSLISAQPVKPIIQPVGTLSEADSLLAIQALKIANIGTLAETNILLPVGVSIFKTIGTLGEVNSLLTISAEKPLIQAVGTLLEADGLIAVLPVKPIIQVVGTMAQVDSLIAIGALKPIFTPVGTLAETETLIGVALILGQPVALFMKVTSKHYDPSVTSKGYDTDQTSTVEGTP